MGSLNCVGTTSNAEECNYQLMVNNGLSKKKMVIIDEWCITEEPVEKKSENIQKMLGEETEKVKRKPTNAEKGNGKASRANEESRKERGHQGQEIGSSIPDPSLVSLVPF